MVTESSQTDEFVYRAPPGAYVPPKIGMDVGTQVNPETGDLFSFDVEVQPILDVIISKTMEQALMEVRQEEQLLDLRQRKVWRHHVCVCNW